jgi:hypothetical protein
MVLPKAVPENDSGGLRGDAFGPVRVSRKDLAAIAPGGTASRCLPP